MSTDTRAAPHAARRFVAHAVGISLGLSGLLRLNWTEGHVVLPVTQMQAQVGAALLGPPSSPVVATLACSGSDALALCAGAVLAFPAPWPLRLAGAAGGTALILALNTLRIGTLGHAAGSPTLFDALHLYAWPAVLTITIAGYVFGWMRFADRRRVLRGPSACDGPLQLRGSKPTRRFVLTTVAFLLAFAAASPLYLRSAVVLAVAGFIARAAAATLGVVGVAARADANALWTARGGFAVTQECISTPLIPVYLAAVCTYSANWRRLTIGVLATIPLFIALGLARLLVVAVPEAVIASPTFLVHAFYQLLLGVVVVYLGASWAHGSARALRYALAGTLAGALVVALSVPLLTRGLDAWLGPQFNDPQGAIAFMPAFQLGLYAALGVAAFRAVGGPRLYVGLAALALLVGASVFLLGALANQPDLTPDVPAVRAWSVAAPVIIFAAGVRHARTCS